MGSDDTLDVSALAINVTIPEALRWTDTRRGETYTLCTLNVRLLRDGRLAAKAYGRPVGGGRANYVSFPVPDGTVAPTGPTRSAQSPASAQALGPRENPRVKLMSLTYVSSATELLTVPSCSTCWRTSAPRTSPSD